MKYVCWSFSFHPYTRWIYGSELLKLRTFYVLMIRSYLLSMCLELWSIASLASIASKNATSRTDNKRKTHLPFLLIPAHSICVHSFHKEPWIHCSRKELREIKSHRKNTLRIQGRIQVGELGPWYAYLVNYIFRTRTLLAA